jgi:hypothetical protein
MGAPSFSFSNFSLIVILYYSYGLPIEGRMTAESLDRTSISTPDVS